MVGALPTFIALVLGSACLVAGGVGGLAGVEDSHIRSSVQGWLRGESV
jgi:hypothetical protein